MAAEFASKSTFSRSAMRSLVLCLVRPLVSILARQTAAD